MMVYRDGKSAISASSRGAALRRAFLDQNALDALLLAGELECALTDLRSASAPSAFLAAEHAAESLLDRSPLDPRFVFDVPSVELQTSKPEGFAYYAVHPLDYAACADRLPTPNGHALVVGIRSIGTTLSAIVKEALRRRGTRTERLTVRPTGHPFDRELCEWPSEASSKLGWAKAQGATCVVVDEGPGASGSTFLAVAEALEREGIARERIVLMPSHAPLPARLCARDAAKRWARFSCLVAAPTRDRPERAARDLSGGSWRSVLGAPSGCPVWPMVERRKFLSDDRQSIWKFEGLAHYGAPVLERIAGLAQAGLGPKVLEERDGFVRTERLSGKPLTRSARFPSEPILRRLELCTEAISEVELERLEEMVQVNTRELLGKEHAIVLRCEHPWIVDGRMMPHEWIGSASSVWKVDGASHGEDHFYPGPCDIAWDVAGAAHEWGLDDQGTADFVDACASRLRDSTLTTRFPEWSIAYAAFRAGFLSMARDSCAGMPEERALTAECERMRSRLARLVPR